MLASKYEPIARLFSTIVESGQTWRAPSEIIDFTAGQGKAKALGSRESAVHGEMSDRSKGVVQKIVVVRTPEQEAAP